jgi:hypothetical protein
MSVRESPVQNRICDIQDKDRAYKKHLDAVAAAKSVIDTSAPKPRPPRPKFSLRNRAPGKPTPAAPPRKPKSHPIADGPAVPEGDCVDIAVKIGFGRNPIIEELRRIPKQTAEDSARRTPPPQKPETPAEIADSPRRTLQFEDDFLTDDSEEADEDEFEEDQPEQPRQDPENFDEIPELEFPDL